MGNLQILAYFYLIVGLIYALWLWLFKGATFFSIPVNTVFGPVYILGILMHFLNWRKKTIHSLFRGKKAVIFDLDGTIIDDQRFWDQAIENVKKQANLDIEGTFAFGFNVADKWANMLKGRRVPTRYSVSELAKMTNEEFLRLFKDVDVRAGFWTFVKYLKDKGFKLGLASNSDRFVVDELLRRLDLGGAFDATIAGDEVKRYKPDPEMYNTMANMLKVSPKSAVIFEDSITGTQAAVDSGMGTVVIWDGELSKVLYPYGVKFFLDDFSGLDEMIEKTPKQILDEEIKEANEANV